MELLGGISLFQQQFIALLKKNSILAWRSRKATLFRLFLSFFFIAFVSGLKKLDKESQGIPGFSVAVRDPVAVTNPPIPACEAKLIINVPCYDFVWSGSGNPRLESIVDGIMDNNPGRSIPHTKVKSFKTKDELNDWLMQNPMRSPGALHLVETNNMAITYGIVINSSSSTQIARQIEDPVFQFQVPLQYAASREISRSLLGDQNFSFDIGLKEFAHPASKIDSSKTGDGSKFLQTFQGVFFFAVSMFGFTFQVDSLVLEKELKLRQTMSIMGLSDTAYWSSWFIWEGLMASLHQSSLLLLGHCFEMIFS